MIRVARFVPLAVLSIAFASLAQAQGKRRPIDPTGTARLVADSGAQVSVHEATGAARFVRTARHSKTGLLKQAARAESVEAKRGRATEFVAAYGSIFGIANASVELDEVRVAKDRRGGTHITYRQLYRGLPVFAGQLRAHFDASDQLVAVNGTFVPELLVDPSPRRSAAEAGQTAVAKVAAAAGRAGPLSAVGTTLLVFREGLAKGVPGPNHLAWQVEVADGGNVREFVYVDAHSGKFVDQITGVYDGKSRRAYDGEGETAPGPNYPASPFWVEGDALPTSSLEADNMILASGETYDMFSTGLGRDSFDGSGAIMDSIFNRGDGCPNASWNGLFISFCPGTTTDDITAHEWGHAYTQYTHDLIYQWQPGALNESYSDIWGETIDRINGRGLDAPGATRTASSCTAFTELEGELVVNSPAVIAGIFLAQSAQFGPNLTTSGTTGAVVLALDPAVVGSPSPTDGCSPLTNAAEVAGNIALIDRGTCNFSAKVYNAQLAGAIGVIIANNVAAGLPPMGAGVNAALVTIPSVGVELATGSSLKANLAVGVDATLRATFTGPIDNSYRWLMGEESTAFGGAIRDMWNPTCYGNAGKVSDVQYTCSTSDGGGVHSNSGVPNHGFALLVDGGSYNGHTVGQIGLTKAAHVYFQAMTAYQVPASDFADHADALEQSCSDLLGANLADLSTGAPSGEIITASDCDQVAEAAAAVELRTPPTQCGFQPLLAKNPPDACDVGTVQANLYAHDFETNPLGSWTVAHAGATSDFTPRDWEWTSSLPDRTGSAMFGVDFTGGTCAPGGDESGVLQLLSPLITLPSGAANPALTFDHWVATEGGFDGGNLKVSVNAGPWQVIAATDYTYNPYNSTLLTADNTNPMAGEPAFTGSDGGSVTGSWGRSHVNLTNYAGPGDTIRLRFDFGTDGCGGVTGWYLDDPSIYVCLPAGPPTISIADVQVLEGNSKFTTATFRVSLSQASATPTSARYRTHFGTAKPGLDYLRTLSRVTIAPLELEVDVSVSIIGDKQCEADETFLVNLDQPEGGAILDGQAQVTILNDDTCKN